MYPQGNICLSEGVKLRLVIEEKNIFTYHLFPNRYTYISRVFLRCFRDPIQAHKIENRALESEKIIKGNIYEI